MSEVLIVVCSIRTQSSIRTHGSIIVWTHGSMSRASETASRRALRHTSTIKAAALRHTCTVTAYTSSYCQPLRPHTLVAQGRIH
jgi:hypothetical protein